MHTEALTIFDKLKAHDVKATEDYQALAGKIAAGDPPAEKAIFSTLTAAGKSVDDLQRDVERLHQRLDAIAKRKAAEVMKSELTAASNEVQATADAIDAMRERHRQEGADLEQRRLNANQAREVLANKQAGLFDQAKRVLVETESPELREKIAVKHRERGAIAEQLDKLRGNLASFQKALDAQREKNPEAQPGSGLANIKSGIAEQSAALATVEQDLAAMEKQIADAVGGMSWSD